MTLFLDRIDAAPIANSDFDAQFLQWLWVLVDTLNENLNDLQNALLSFFSVTAATQSVEVNSSYIATNASQTVFQLPDTAAEGVRVAITGRGAGGWQLLPGTGQTIKVASTGGSAATSLTSSSQYDSIEILCVHANTTWVTTASETAGFVLV